MKLNATQNFLKKVRKASFKTQQTLHQKQSDLAVVKERIKTQQQTIDGLNHSKSTNQTSIK